MSIATHAQSAIADCAPTAGPRRKENDKTHGIQPGDPTRAAQALSTLAHEATFPARCVTPEQDDLPHHPIRTDWKRT